MIKPLNASKSCFGFNSKTIILILVSGIFICSCRYKDKTESKTDPVVLVSPLGKELVPTPPGKKMMEQYETARQAYLDNPEVIDNIIWYGRRTAYLGKYSDAIAIYTEGIQKFPEDPRLYRHRGHRYISIRQFDKAIEDLERAGQLIHNTENQIEPDGIPNAQNIPVSSLHGNIWYHLGLAYYLKHNYKKANEAYLKCRASGGNSDNVVSSTHWLYMIQRRLGNEKMADSMLAPIQLNTEVIENTNYNMLCKFYKGLVPIDSLLVEAASGSASDATKYGLANWYFYNQKEKKAKDLMEELVDGDSWSSFGYIAAESDLTHYFK